MKTEVRKLRESTGRTLTAFAIGISMSPAHLSLIERGARPNKATAERIIAGLNEALKAVSGGVHIVNPEDAFPDFATFRGA